MVTSERMPFEEDDKKDYLLRKKNQEWGGHADRYLVGISTLSHISWPGITTP